MKRLLFSVMALVFLTSSNNGIAQAQSKMDKDYPYKAVYSSSFTIGKADYAKKVLELWKDFDDNDFDRHDYMSDTVTIMLPDGMISKGKAACLAEAKKYRGTFTSVKSTIHAWVPLTSTDRHEDAVCVWGTEKDTSPDGKVEERDLHEVWWFNKDGKVTMIRQWAAKFGK